MHLGRFMLALLVGSGLWADTSASQLWNDLNVKRDSLKNFQQTFEVIQTHRRGSDIRTSKRSVAVTVAQGLWREKTSSGSGTFIHMFDGKNAYRMEEEGGEFERVKQTKFEPMTPSAYDFKQPDVSKVKEVERGPCPEGLPHECVTLQMPLKNIRLFVGTRTLSRINGVARLQIDLASGLVIGTHIIQVFEDSYGAYSTDTGFAIRSIGYNNEIDMNMFKLPEKLREVRELSRWDAKKIKKELLGKPAPELPVSDLTGRSIHLEDYKGKTVLLDFWASWCPPCREDAPALDKLYRKYQAKDLMILGIAVDESREVVEKFLQQHPNSFPMVLTSENDMPRPYQINLVPTYMVIDGDGKLTAVAQGDQGFNNLRKLLRKAGLETD